MAYSRTVENFNQSDTMRVEGSGWDNTLIRNGTIDGAAGDGFFIKDVKNVRIENVTIKNVGGSGIRLSSSGGSQDVLIEGNTITNVGVNGISASQRADIGVDHIRLKIRNNYIQNTGRKSPGNGLDHGIYVQTSDVLVEYNTVLNSQAGNGVSIRSSGIVRYNTIDGAYEAGVGYYPDHVKGPSNTLVVHGNVIKNWGKASANYGGVMIKTGSVHANAVEKFVTTNNQFGNGASSGDAWYIQSSWYNGYATFEHSGDVAWSAGLAPPWQGQTNTPPPDTGGDTGGGDTGGGDTGGNTGGNTGGGSTGGGSVPVPPAPGGIVSGGGAPAFVLDAGTLQALAQVAIAQGTSLSLFMDLFNAVLTGKPEEILQQRTAVLAALKTLDSSLIEQSKLIRIVLGLPA